MITIGNAIEGLILISKGNELCFLVSHLPLYIMLSNAAFFNA